MAPRRDRRRGQIEIDEARPGDFHLCYLRVFRQGADDPFRQIAGLHACRIDIDHGGIGGEIAVRGIAGAFHHGCPALFRIDNALGYQAVQGDGNQIGNL